MFKHSACTVPRMVAHRMIRAVCVTDFSHISLYISRTLCEEGRVVPLAAMYGHSQERGFGGLPPRRFSDIITWILLMCN